MTFENEYMLFGNVKSWKSLKNTITLLSLVDFSSWPQISLFLYRSLFFFNAICSWNVNLGTAIVVFWVRIVRHAAYLGTNLCDDGIFRSELYLGKTGVEPPNWLDDWVWERLAQSNSLAAGGELVTGFKVPSDLLQLKSEQRTWTSNVYSSFRNFAIRFRCTLLM